MAAIWFVIKQNDEPIERLQKIGIDIQALDHKKKLLTFDPPLVYWSQNLKDDGNPANFDLFTNPQVLKQDGNIIINSYDDLNIEDVVPLFLLEIKNKPYRIKLDGYYKTDGVVTLMFSDINSGKSEECHVNESAKDLRIWVREFGLQKQEYHGTILEVPHVTIYDENLKVFMNLTNDQKLLDDEFIVVIADREGNKYVFQDIETSITIKESECKIRSVNKKDNSVKISLKDANNNEFNRTLYIMR